MPVLERALPLDEILLLLLCGTMRQAGSFVETAGRDEINLGFLRRFLLVETGIPSHGTLNGISRSLDLRQFQDSLTAWTGGLQTADQEFVAVGRGEYGDVPRPQAGNREIIAIDDKTSRRTGNRWRGRSSLHMLSAWSNRNRPVLGQQAAAGGTNEISAVPLLMEKLAPKSALVTIDTTGCQRESTEQTNAASGNWLRAVKGNQKIPEENIRCFFKSDAEHSALDCHENVDSDHGRIKNRLHWVFDVTFHDDIARLRTDHAAQNMAAVKHMALNLITKNTEKPFRKSPRPLVEVDDRRRGMVMPR